MFWTVVHSELFWYIGGRVPRVVFPTRIALMLFLHLSSFECMSITIAMALYTIVLFILGLVGLIEFHYIYMLCNGTMVITLYTTFGFGYRSKCDTPVIQSHHLIGSQNTEDWNVRCHIIS